MLVCPRCEARLKNPGGSPENYICGNCGSSGLYRDEDVTNETIAAATIGAIIGGVLTGGAGAIEWEST